MFTTLCLLAACTNKKSETAENIGKDSTFEYKVDRFADIEILRYEVPGFESLSLQQKELIYYLSQAAVEGRDILYDQHNKYNLVIRRTLENIYTEYKGDKNSQDWKNLEIYLKRIWMANGIHHHYSEDKFIPEFSKSFKCDTISS